MQNITIVAASNAMNEQEVLWGFKEGNIRNLVGGSSSYQWWWWWDDIWGINLVNLSYSFFLDKNNIPTLIVDDNNNNMDIFTFTLYT